MKGDDVREGVGCLLQALAASLIIIAFAVADAIADGRLP